MQKIGKVSATEKNPTSCDEFIFWLDQNVEVKPFDIITVENNIASKKTKTFGIIKEVEHITDSTGHLTSYISSDFGDVSSEPLTNRIGVTYAKVEVISNDHEVFMPLRDGQPVYFATKEDISKALGLDNIKNPIPAGYIQTTNGLTVPISVNKDFLLGKEGAHVNISGISGLATKTSYAMFLLQAIQQKSEDTAFIILNVKGSDLLNIDMPVHPGDHREDEWSSMGLEFKPFENVTYYYPYTNSQSRKYANSAANTETLTRQHEAGILKNYTYTYDENKSNIDLLFSNIDDPNFTIESILNFISEHKDFDDIDWDDLKQLLKEKYTQSGGSSNKDIPVVSWRKFSRLLKKSVDNEIFINALASGSERKQCSLANELQSIQNNEIHVIDIAKIDEQLQSFVFGDVLKSIYDLKFGDTERETNTIPKRIVIFVDELNKYAASTSPKNSPLLRYLLEITERGRSDGIILFSAQQFKSAIHDRVKGNCSTNVFGRTNSIETSKPDYRYLPKVYSNMMTRLRKGELIIQHPIFTTPLKISFPKESYLQGDDN
ncbi:MAG: ATP-binding protein [Halodesulfovibrio sp.]|uniref:ATP-binding protein n=1 Tax=Halodesulfovibrio sp. TaxID=1912772 RepID=UPI00359D6A90